MFNGSQTGSGVGFDRCECSTDGAWRLTGKQSGRTSDIAWPLHDGAVVGLRLTDCCRYCPCPGLTLHFFGNFAVILMNTAPKIAKLDMATSLTECPEFAALQSHYEAASKLHMRSLFEGDPGRFEKFRYSWRKHAFNIDLLFSCFDMFCLDWTVVLISLTL